MFDILFLALIISLSKGLTQKVDPSGKMREICNAKASPTELITLLSGYSTSTSGTESKEITLVSYATPGIYDYAGYSLAINSIYALNSGYTMKMVDPETGNHEPHDFRWNKVKIVEDLLSAPSSKDGEYFVWLDSDLIILDHVSFELGRDIIDQHGPHVDIILSRDPRPENGVVNTGAMVVRNSPFSRAFFHRWWRQFDRKAGMDQHSFDKVWSRAPSDHWDWEDSAGEDECDSGSSGGSEGRECVHYCLDCLGDAEYSSHFAFLPANAINTNFPAHLHQQDTDPVLHLAGLSSVVRSSVFARGLDTLCKAVATAVEEKGDNGEFILLPQAQLGLSRNILSSIALDVSLQERHIQSVEQDMLSLSASLGKSLHDMISSSSSSAAHSAEDVQQHLDLLESGLERLSGIMHALKDNRQTGYDAAADGTIFSPKHALNRMRMAVVETTAKGVSQQLITAIEAMGKQAVRELSTLATLFHDRHHEEEKEQQEEEQQGEGEGEEEAEKSLAMAAWLSLQQVHAQALSTSVRALQLTIEAAFDLLQATLHPPSNPSMMIGEEGDIASTVATARTAITRLRILAEEEDIIDNENDEDDGDDVGAKGSSTQSSKPLRGPVLYYEFKLYQFEAAMFTSRHSGPMYDDLSELERYEGELVSLHRAHVVWRAMHEEEGWYGSGNGLADPAREVVQVRARMGSLYCALAGATVDGNEEENGEWGGHDEGMFALLDALALIMWKWEADVPLLRGLLEDLAGGYYNYHHDHGDEGYPWTVPWRIEDSSSSSSPAAEYESRQGSMGKGLIGWSRLEVPAYVHENLWGVLLALAHAMVGDSTTTDTANTGTAGMDVGDAAGRVMDLAQQQGEALETLGARVDWALLTSLRDSNQQTNQQQQQPVRMLKRKQKQEECVGC